MGAWRPLPSILLFVFAFVILWAARGHAWRLRWARRGAYGLMALALLVGFVAYLDTGGFGDLRIGPIPAGTPVNLLANVNPDAPPDQMKQALRDAIDGINEIESRHLEGADKERVLNQKIAPALMSVNKCPDFVMDKGHSFPWFADMTSEDKEALIELLKTF
jgi:hypothetical protein